MQQLCSSFLLRSIVFCFNCAQARLFIRTAVFAGGLAFYLLIKNRREPVIAMIMILSTVFYHLIAITAFGYSAYPRLRSPIDLLLNVLVLLPLLLFTLYVARAWGAGCKRSVAERIA
jgi:hypothetical protein